MASKYYDLDKFEDTERGWGQGQKIAKGDMIIMKIE